jgi:hypothetical protein
MFRCWGSSKLNLEVTFRKIGTFVSLNPHLNDIDWIS